MNLLRILGLCLCAAMVCAAIRSVHPQIATTVALACGVGVMLLSAKELGSFAAAIEGLQDFAGGMNGENMQLLKLCGIALAAEFASDICRDAGEGALAKRIDVGVRIGIVAAALPVAGKLMEDIAGLLE